MIYNTGTITTVSGSSIVKGTGTKWNSNNPLISPGMLMLIKNGDINYPYMIKAVNSDNELVLAETATFSATNTTYTINLTEPNNNSDAARALVAANTYIIYFLQNMDTWMGDNGVVELTLPSGKTVKLESIKALQELVIGKADVSSVEEIKTALESKADTKSVTIISEKLDSNIIEVNEKLDKKYDKSGGEINGRVDIKSTVGTFINDDQIVTQKQMFGVEQKWADVTTSRAKRTDYKNDTGKPIVVYIETKNAGSGENSFSYGIIVSGMRVAYRWVRGNDEVSSLSAIVPPDASYSASGGIDFQKWLEFR